MGILEDGTLLRHHFPGKKRSQDPSERSEQKTVSVGGKNEILPLTKGTHFYGYASGRLYFVA